MISLLSQRISNSIAHYLNYDDAEEQWLSYGLEIMIGKVINVSIILAIALLLGHLLEVLIFLIIFTSLRKSTGGYHFSNDVLCSAVSLSLCFCTVFMSYRWDNNKSVYMISLLSLLGSLLIITLAPINHPHLHLTEDEMSVLKKRTLLKLCILSPLLHIAVYMPIPKHFIVVGNAAIISVAALILISKMTGQEDAISEKEVRNFRKDGRTGIK